MNRSAWLICGAILSLGCGNAGPAEEVSARLDSAGIEIVTSTATDRELGWDFEKVLSLGGAEAGAESFYRVPSAGLAFDSSGQIYILDSGNKRVLVFDEHGTLAHTIGREGEGPGEFRYPIRLAVDDSGQVLVYDLGHRALIRFGTTGSYLGQVPIAGTVHPRMRVDGSSVVLATRQLEPDSEERVFGIHRLGQNDSTEILTVPVPDMKRVHYEACGLVVPEAPLFSDPLAWDAGAGRIVVAAAPQYSIRVFERGVETKHVRRALESESASREHAVRELGDGQEWEIPRSGTCFVPTSEIIEARGVAEEIPVLENIAVSPSGDIWAQRDVIGEDGGPIDVFNPTGEYIGTLPPSTPWPVDFGPGNSMIVLEEDELGVQFAVVYRFGRG